MARSKMWEIKLQKIFGNLLDKLRKLYLNGSSHVQIFSRPQAIENSSQNLLPWTDNLQETVIGCPCDISRWKWYPTFEIPCPGLHAGKQIKPLYIKYSPEQKKTLATLPLSTCALSPLVETLAMPYVNIQFIFNQFTSITENIIFIKID